MTSLIGQTVSHYEILERLGGGGMGVVYKARDLRLDRPVALKFLPPTLTGDTDARHRFIHEAKAASALQHDNVAVIHDVDETPETFPGPAGGSGGQIFIVMEYYEGETLKKTIGRGPLPVEMAVEYAVQTGEGLAEAHRCGIVHRDIKPANIMITRQGGVKIVDFGIALLLGMTRLTQEGTRVGTAHYMSPEQTRSEDVDCRTDIWALGVLLYEMLTGHPPFESAYEAALVYSILSTDPPPVSSRRPECPPALDDIIRRALRKDPADRYQKMEEMLGDLNALRQTRTAIANPPPGQARTRRRFRRWQTGITVAAFAIALVFGGRILLTRNAPETTPRVVKLGLLPVRNTTGKAEAGEWATRIRENLLPTALNGCEGVSLISTSFLSEAHGLPAEVSSREARQRWYAEAGRAGADFVLEGSLIAEDSSYAFQVNLVDPATGDVRHSASARFAGGAGMGQAISQAACRMMFYLDLEVLHPDGDLKPWIPPRPVDIAAQHAFAEAASIMYTGETGGVRFLREALRIDSTFISPRVWLVRMRMSLGDSNEAKAHYAILTRLSPTASPFESALIEYAAASIARSARGRAHALGKALLFAPGNRILLINLAEERGEIGDFEGAASALEPVVGSSMYYPPAYPDFAHALVTLRRFGEARSALAAGLAMKPVDPETFGLLAAFAASDGDSAGAERYESLYGDRLTDFGRSRQDAEFGIGRYLLDMGSFVSGRRYLERAVAIDPGSALTRCSLARAYHATGDTLPAIREAERALALDPGARDAHLLLGTIADERGDTLSALRHYRRFLSSDSESVTAAHTARRALLLSTARKSD